MGVGMNMFLRLLWVSGWLICHHYESAVWEGVKRVFLLIEIPLMVLFLLFLHATSPTNHHEYFSLRRFQSGPHCCFLLRVRVSFAFDFLLICFGSLRYTKSPFSLFSDVVNSGAFSPSVESDDASRVSRAVEGT